MSEFGGGYRPPTIETKVERQEVSKSPENVPGLNDGISPTPPPTTSTPQDDQTVQDTTPPAETPSQRRLGQMGMSSMQGDTPVNPDMPINPDLPVSKPETTNEWKDLGIVNVPVNQLPNPDGVNSPADFNHHISWENAQSALSQLPQVQQEVANGKTGDDFDAEDAAAELDWQHGKKRVFDLFYSPTDPVMLEKDGTEYSIISGRHRIFAAKEMGLKSIPAHVREKSR